MAGSKPKQAKRPQPPQSQSPLVTQRRAIPASAPTSTAKASRSSSADAPPRTPSLRSRRDRNPTRPQLVRSGNAEINDGIVPDLTMLDYRPPSRDAPGMPARWSLTVTPSFDAEVRRMVGSGLYFEDFGELVRWCVFFGMDYLQRIIHPPFSSNVQVLKAMAANSAHFETRLQYMQSIERDAKNSYEALGRGLEAAAVQLVSKQIEVIRGLSPDDPFRAEILKLIKQRFGHMLKKGQLVTFDELDES